MRDHTQDWTPEELKSETRNTTDITRQMMNNKDKYIQSPNRAARRKMAKQSRKKNRK